MVNDNLTERRLLSFSENSHLNYVSGNGAPYIEKKILIDRGVLCFSVPRGKGWRQEFFNIEKFDVLYCGTWSEIIAFRFQLMISKSFFEKLGWMELSIVLHNNLQPWVQLKEIDVKNLRPERWSQVTVNFIGVDNSFISVNSVNRVIFAFNSEFEINGNIYLADFEVIQSKRQ